MRSLNTIKNMYVSLIFHSLNIVLTFVCRTVFIKLLATEYLGLSGLFTNILSVLSLSELGIGNAIIINLYKPLAEKNENAICKYMNFYCRAYRVIGCFILLFGLVSMPFLEHMVKTSVEIPNIELIYFLFVTNSAVSYFCAYKRTILTADQKEYINTVNRNVFLIIQNIFQIIVLILTNSYVLYVCVMVLCTILSNIRIMSIANKKYPYLNTNKTKLNSDEIKELIKSLKAILYHKAGNTILNSTDNIIISVILGVYWVGLYSNYSMIIGVVTTFALIVFSACSASIGNFNAVESNEKVFKMFKVVSFIGFWIYGFCSICFLILFQPFIELWIGNQYKLDNITLLIIVVAFFLKGIINITTTFLDVTKLFIKTRMIPWIMAGINLIISIILAKNIGLVGVFVGTVVSYVLTEFWINPYVLCKYKFNVKFYVYLKFMIYHLLVILLVGIVAYSVVGNIENFVIKTVLTVVLAGFLPVLCYYKTDEFKYLYNILKTIIKIKKNKVV